MGILRPVSSEQRWQPLDNQEWVLGDDTDFSSKITTQKNIYSFYQQTYIASQTIIVQISKSGVRMSPFVNLSCRSVQKICQEIKNVVHKSIYRMQQFSFKFVLDVKKQNRQAVNLALFIMCWL
jgi:hypothetical protein